MCLCHHRSPVARDSSRAFASLSTFNFGLLTSFSPTLSHTSEKSPASSKYCHTSKTPSRNSFTIRTSETPLPQLLYNPHLRAPFGSAGNKGLVTPLESALTRNSPVTSLESALTKRWGWGPRFPSGTRHLSLVTCSRIQVLLFSYTSKLFCTRQKLNPFVFIQIHALCAKHRGWGLRATGWSRFRPRGSRAWR